MLSMPVCLSMERHTGSATNLIETHAPCHRETHALCDQPLSDTRPLPPTSQTHLQEGHFFLFLRKVDTRHGRQNECPHGVVIGSHKRAKQMAHSTICLVRPMSYTHTHTHTYTVIYTYLSSNLTTPRPQNRINTHMKRGEGGGESERVTGGRC
jgi:hypothetical protein